LVPVAIVRSFRRVSVSTAVIRQVNSQASSHRISDFIPDSVMPLERGAGCRDPLRRDQRTLRSGAVSAEIHVTATTHRFE
jgi:hypothetical protein